jgi:hypothetical protein
MGAGAQTTRQFADQVDVVREELAAHGRSPETFRIGKRLYVSRGRRRGPRAPATRGRSASPLRRGDFSEVISAGPPDACIAGIRAVAEAGAELILLNPLIDDADQLERLAPEIIPELA